MVIGFFTAKFSVNVRVAHKYLKLSVCPCASIYVVSHFPNRISTIHIHFTTCCINNVSFFFSSSEGRYVKTLWKDVQVGDLIRLSNNETIPADMVVLKSSDKIGGLCYIDTQNLDGEANLKQRQVPRGYIDEVMKKLIEGERCQQL